MPVTVGRKNWLISDSTDGANASAIVYSVVEIAKAHNLNIYRYLVYLLNHRPDNTMSDEELENMAPWKQEVINACGNKME
jgi:hypothetical protein